jgi:hypothetical protein
MEGFGGIIHRAVQSPTFKYHWRCKPTNLTHLSFADDLMLFCHADVGSIEVLQTSLSKFSSLSSLTINHAKSKLYMSGIDAALRTTIADKLGIQETTLPVKHLGVPLISTRLTHADCIPLVERITARIKLWTSTSLTYAGRLQLIKSILFSIQVYWSSIFILPGATIKKIESILAAFLWKDTTLSTAGAKVSWSSICYPLQEGGLGIKRLKVWNRAVTIKHIWCLLTNGESIWISWVKKHLLRDRSIWHINIPSNPSWSWRKILQSHDYCRGWFITSIGNGSSTSLWYDYWLPDGARFIDLHTIRTLTSTGLPWTSKVSDIIIEGHWNFPWDISILHATWNSIIFHPKIHTEDQCVWKGHSSGIFTIALAWELLRERRPITNMHHLLWYPGHIPRQSFILWLACLGRLQTMDRLNSVGIIENNICILCSHHAETHENLFFKCTTSLLIWQTVNAKANLQWPICPWQHLIR